MRKIKKVTKLITHMVMLIPLSSTSWSQPLKILETERQRSEDF
ncbi:MAG: hypothetical protein QX197_00995 [Methylococcaceae bacterium]